MHVTKPLFRFDPGWLFIVAGMAICMAVVLLPARHDLFMLESQRAALRARELHNNARLRVHVDFLEDVDHADPDLIERLIASQLNLIPQGETPVLRAAHSADAVQYWLEMAAPEPDFELPEFPETTLSRLASGPRRIWLMAGGVLSIFCGLLTGGPFSGRPGAEQSPD